MTTISRLALGAREASLRGRGDINNIVGGSLFRQLTFDRNGTRLKRVDFTLALSGKAAMARYDEDLHENVFFHTLVTKFNELFREAAENKWMVRCIQNKAHHAWSLTLKTSRDLEYQNILLVFSVKFIRSLCLQNGYIL